MICVDNLPTMQTPEFIPGIRKRGKYRVRPRQDSFYFFQASTGRPDSLPITLMEKNCAKLWLLY